MIPPYLICEFAKETLSSLVRERFGDEFRNIIKKRQVQYLYNYLKDIKAKTILLESEYVDKDYLDDYSRYYVRCFNRYGERCARLHFFSTEFDTVYFDKVLNEYEEEQVNNIKNSYLGFIIVKPLPRTFIGKTCLRTYPNFNNNDNKKILTRQYQVNLFGLDLSVQSIAFQEQDKVISACATTAIWSALHAQPFTDNQRVPSCSAITLSAINHIEDSSNSFPNNGLTNKQILRALDTQNFRNHKIELKAGLEQSQFIEIIKIFTDSNIPLILGTDVYKLKDNIPTKVGSHAVTILGYKKKDHKGYAIYIHDDRIGPFSKASLRLTADFPKSPTPDLLEWCITLQDKDDSGKWKNPEELLIPEFLIIPTNPKVRIPFDYIQNTCNAISEEWSRFCDTIAEEENLTPAESPLLEYEVSLTNLREFKSKILAKKTIKNKSEILTQGYARFLWAATFFLKNRAPVFEIIFDATDIPQGNAVATIVIYNENIFRSIRDFFVSIDEDKMLDSDFQNFLSSFIAKLKLNDNGYMGYLNSMYGIPCAPKRLYNSEIIDGKLILRDDIKKYYGHTGKKLEDDFPELMAEQSDTDNFRIWVISFDGALLIGEEKEEMGHPTLTQFKAARIAGELRFTDGIWKINAKSGRYSSNYSNSQELLQNAVNKFKEVYSEENNIQICLFRE